ncbi:hypothetical protein EDB92DRAFT_2119373 [Lactarius akahatsu]|uniref:DUF6535 domain-containing protein n=1 Tax=Lactarius akahatsu TaxID=416441 RepID=A0AAD4L8K9_9AGAM|nr:hypothetical protein EDB92DRAFT_2119373 [Lactarius akahatsu]
MAHSSDTDWFPPSSSSSELGHTLVETPPPESRPINHGSIALPSLPMPPSSAKHEQFETLAGEWEDAKRLSALPLSSELASHPKEERQEHAHVFPTPVEIHGHPHHRPHANDSFRLQDPPMIPFVPPASVVFINSVWFLCLVLSLTCALMATLLQQ